MAWHGSPHRSKPSHPARARQERGPGVPAPMKPARGGHREDTSWEKSADWYDRIIGERGSDLYRGVVLPGALGLLAPQKGERVLDLGCGQGVFTRALAEKGCEVTGVDLSPSLIAKARSYPSRRPARYLVRDGAALDGLGEFDALSAILCLQNMEHLAEVCAACARVLRPGGRMVWVMNHPAYRIPRQSAWGQDEQRKIQFRRVDAYATEMRIPIVMHPGRKDSEETVSFHRCLAALMQPAFAAGLVLAGLEEWCSDKESQPGPRARAENRARKEFPLFLALLWKKPADTPR